MKTVLAVVLLWLSTNAIAQVQRCTMPDGKVVYSDTPCPKNVTESKILSKRTAPVAISSAANLPLPQKLEFSGTPQTDLIKASALMDNIKTIGRDCEWALKVQKDKIASCIDFMGKLQPDGEYQQISEQVSVIIKDRDVAQQSISELRTINRHMEGIVRYKEFMLANLGVSSKR